jgi:hypothetical protein
MTAVAIGMRCRVLALFRIAMVTSIVVVMVVFTNRNGRM